jgi:hypothetical protein
MRMRLMGTREEVAAVLPVLVAVFDVQETSDFYPNRGAPQLGRIYLDIGGLRRNPVQAETRRADTGQPQVEGRPAIEGHREGDAR